MNSLLQGPDETLCGIISIDCSSTSSPWRTAPITSQGRDCCRALSRMLIAPPCWRGEKTKNKKQKQRKRFLCMNVFYCSWMSFAVSVAPRLKKKNNNNENFDIFSCFFVIIYKLCLISHFCTTFAGKARQGIRFIFRAHWKKMWRKRPQNKQTKITMYPRLSSTIHSMHLWWKVVSLRSTSRTRLWRTVLLSM